MAKKNWQDIGSVKARQAARGRQWAADAAWRAAHKTATVSDTDNLETIAQQAGVDPADILAANPELKTLRTGMVVNIPPTGAPMAYRPNTVGSPLVAPSSFQQSQGQPYLPSNANLGTQGGGWRGNMGYAPVTQPPNPYGIQNTTNYYATSSAPRNVLGQIAGTNTPAALMNPNRTVAPTTPAAQPVRPVRPPTTSLPMSYPGGFMRWAKEELNQSLTDPNYTPNEMAVKVLQRAGLLEPVTQYASGGAYNYQKRRKGGGGGGGGRTATARVSEPRAPAFSNGSGGFGLINWRI